MPPANNGDNNDVLPLLLGAVAHHVGNMSKEQLQDYVLRQATNDPANIVPTLMPTPGPRPQNARVQPAQVGPERTPPPTPSSSVNAGNVDARGESLAASMGDDVKMDSESSALALERIAVKRYREDTPLVNQRADRGDTGDPDDFFQILSDEEEIEASFSKKPKTAKRRAMAPTVSFVVSSGSRLPKQDVTDTNRQNVNLSQSTASTPPDVSGTSNIKPASFHPGHDDLAVAPAPLSDIEGDPAMPQFDAEGNLTRLPSEPIWLGRPLSEVAKNEWLTRLGIVIAANTADHFKWQSDDQRPHQIHAFYLNVLECAKYTSFADRSTVIALFASPDEVKAFCEANASELRKESLGFRENVRLFPSEKNKTVSRPAPSTTNSPQAPQVVAETLTANAEDVTGQTVAGEEREEDDAGLGCRPPGRDRLSRGTKFLGRGDLGYIALRPYHPNVDRVDNPKEQLIPALKATPLSENTVPVVLGLKVKHSLLFGKHSSVSQAIHSRHFHIASESPAFAALGGKGNDREIALARGRWDRLSAIKRPTEGYETILRKWEGPIGWSIAGDDFALVERMTHRLIVKYRDPRAISFVMKNGPYTPIFKLADGIKIIVSIADQMLDLKDTQRPQLYSSSTWATIKACLPILIETLSIYEPELKTALRNDPVYRQVVLIITGCGRRAAVDQMPVFHLALQKISSL